MWIIVRDARARNFSEASLTGTDFIANRRCFTKNFIDSLNSPIVTITLNYFNKYISDRIGNCIFKPSYNLFDCLMCDTRHIVALVRFGFVVVSNLFRAKKNVVVISIAIRIKYKRSNMIKNHSGNASIVFPAPSWYVFCID